LRSCYTDWIRTPCGEARGDTFTSIPKEVLDQHDPLGVASTKGECAG
jgi:hypothetical protein